MDPRTEKAIKKTIEALKGKTDVNETYLGDVKLFIHVAKSGNASFRFMERMTDKLIAQFSLNSIIKKRVAKRKAK